MQDLEPVFIDVGATALTAPIASGKPPALKRCPPRMRLPPTPQRGAFPGTFSSAEIVSSPEPEQSKPDAHLAFAARNPEPLQEVAATPEPEQSKPDGPLAFAACVKPLPEVATTPEPKQSKPDGPPAFAVCSRDSLSEVAMTPEPQQSKPDVPLAIAVCNPKPLPEVATTPEPEQSKLNETTPKPKSQKSEACPRKAAEGLPIGSQTAGIDLLAGNLLAGRAEESTMAGRAAMYDAKDPVLSCALADLISD